MRTRTTLVFVLLVLALCSTSIAKYVDGLVYDELSTVVGPQPSLLIFTVKWCSHCKALQPEIKALARAVRHNPKVAVARIDADEEPAIAQKFNVQGYPSILFAPEGYNLRDPQVEPIEYADYRWAEIIAQFVNNETRDGLIEMEPREAFLKWRKRNPHNIGRRPVRKPERASSVGGSSAGSDIKSSIRIREPVAITSSNFITHVIEDRTMRFIILFCREDDPFQNDVLLQWRQASSAFTQADNVTVGVVNLSESGSAELEALLDIHSTPDCLYFSRCDDTNAEDKDCKKPIACKGDIESTESLVQFLSERMMIEMGIDVEQVKALGETSAYQLTEEQYQKMRKEGKLFANDPEQVAEIRAIHDGKMASRTPLSEDKVEL